MPSLTALTMSRCSGITDEGVAALQPLAPTLQQLELGMCSKLTHEGLAGLHKLSNLTKLNLSACKVSSFSSLYSYCRYTHVSEDK
jgi:Leucine-rich repeat (LRR) protein